MHQYPLKRQIFIFIFSFHPLEVVARYRDPQLQVGENYTHLFDFRPNICKSSR